MTIGGLKRRAIEKESWKKNDSEFTCWEVLVMQMGDNVTVDCNYLQQQSMQEKYCMMLLI